MVNVISKTGQPIMPTENHAKVRLLLIFDRVQCKGQEGFVFGRRSSGGFDVRKLNGERISPNINCKKLKHLESRKALLISF